MSFADALPKLIIKLACLSETSALPTLKPYNPQSSKSFAAKVSFGFLNVEPAVGQLRG